MTGMNDPIATAAAHLRAGRHAEAKAACRDILAGNPRNASALSILGTALEKTGRFESAVAILRRAVAARPGDAGILAELGNALARVGDIDMAVTALERALDLDLDAPKAALLLSAIRRRQNRGREARALLEDSVARTPFRLHRCPGEARARVFKVRGMQNAFYTLRLSHTGYFRTVFSTGNFSVRHLIDPQRFDICDFLVANDDLLAVDGLPAFDIVVNTIADPDNEAKSLQTLARFLKRRPDVPVINPPGRVLTTTRDGNYRRLASMDGIVFPRTVRLNTASLTKTKARAFLEANGFTFPLIVRKPGTQTGRTTELAGNFTEFMSYCRKRTTKSVYVIQYFDEKMDAEHFRKMRFFCIDGRLYPAVCHIDRTWNVHGGNRKTLMRKNLWMQDEEKRFLADPSTYIGKGNYRILEGFHRVLGLDFFAIDFTRMEDGRLLIYETNAAVRHSLDHARNFPYLIPYLEDVSRAFEAMIVSRTGGARSARAATDGEDT